MEKQPSLPATSTHVKAIISITKNKYYSIAGAVFTTVVCSTRRTATIDKQKFVEIKFHRVEYRTVRSYCCLWRYGARNSAITRAHLKARVIESYDNFIITRVIAWGVLERFFPFIAFWKYFRILLNYIRALVHVRGDGDRFGRVRVN